MRNIHYIPIKTDLSDLVEKLEWARNNDHEAKQIAKNGQKFANENLLPKDIFCYYAMLLDEFSKKVVSDVNVLNGMDRVEQPKENVDCDCFGHNIKEEL